MSIKSLYVPFDQKLNHNLAAYNHALPTNWLPSRSLILLEASRCFKTSSKHFRRASSNNALLQSRA
uniref:Uncharacterized protein n=1 Tax=Anguilla anguilla TaxID=7936 RepID=A0A0E9RQE2_ANGAN